MSFKIESDFIHKKLRCIVLATDMGHRCGYVEVRAKHPLYKLYYSDRSEKLKYALKKRKKKPMGEQPSFAVMISCLSGKIEPSPDVVFEVHGGITFSNHGKEGYPVKSKGWWFGFDASHCDDAKDPMLMNEEWKKIGNHFRNGVVRTKE